MTVARKQTADNKWLEMLFQQTPDGIVLQDSAGTIIEANASFAKICNQPIAAIKGRKFPDLLSPACKARWNHDLAKLLKGEWSRIEEACIFVDGRQIPVEVALIAKTVQGGRDVEMLHVRNISVYHTVETALLASQKQWELSFNAINDAMYIVGQNNHILQANQAALHKIMPSLADPIGADFSDIFKLKKNNAAFETLRSRMFSEAGVLTSLEFEGMPGKFNLTSYPIKNSKGNPTGCIVIIKDITEQHRQELLRKLIEMCQQRNHRIDALERLAGGIAHDFNNILTSLLGNVSLVMQSDNLNQNDRENLRETIHTIERGSALTRQLFDFSTEKEVEFKTINLNAVIQDMQALLLQVLGPNINMTTHLDQQLWNVNAEVSRVERIITNFAANSRDAMPSGGEFAIETGNTILDDNFCKNHPEFKPGNFVLLQVSDTGNGMPLEMQERIFEPFFTTKEKGKGMGLGLSSVFGIVRQFGGQIICYSEPGRGTTFKVYLPQSTEKASGEPPRPEPGNLPRGSETILIVDDEVHIVSMLNQFLSKIGYKVLSATNSSRAISLCKEQQAAIDVVLSDIIMPDMNGTELFSILREHRPQIKAVFMSGYNNSMAAESTGMDKSMVFLQKPFTFEELARKIRVALGEPPK